MHHFLFHRPELFYTPPLWTDLVKMFFRKLRHVSFFSFERTDFKNVIFEKIHWAHSEVIEVKRSKEKDEACHSFLENIFTKSVHRGGVALSKCVL